MANFTSPAMDNFCGSSFWDYDLTWNTTNPYFTNCFEKTVLIWLPCLFLWLFSPIEVYYLLTSKKRNVPWSWINETKLAITAGLIILMIADIWTAFNAVESDSTVPSVNIYSPLIRLLSLALSGLLVYYNKRHGMHTSGLLFLFWLLMFLFGIPQFRSEINPPENINVTPVLYSSHIIYLIYFPCVIIMFLLNCIADKPALETKHFKTDNPSPEESASFLSHLLFMWFDKLAWTGFKRPLEQKDLWDMNPEDSSRELVPKFEKYWHKTLEKVGGQPVQQTQATFQANSGHVDFVQKPKKKEASVLPAIFKCFGSIYLFGAIMKLFQDLLTFVSPQVLGLMIRFVADLSAPTWKGYFYAFLLFFTASIQTLVLAQYFNRMFIIGMRIRSVLVAIIYKKALRISNAAKKESTVGEIVNLMAVDAQRFMDLVGYINMIWSAPLQIILSLYFLWQELGPSVLAGLAVMIILIPINGFIANKVKSLQIKQMKNKDERVKLMNEILSGMKVLKLYAWEPSFENQVLKIRNKEIHVLKQTAYLNAGTSFIWSCAPFLVSLVTFATYVLVDENNILDANKAYVSISLFNIIRFPLSMLPMMISNLIQTYVSVKRINKFMNAEELDPNNVQHEPNQEHPLTIEGGTFSWGEDSILKDINIQLRKGTLTAVVGTVGSGKSSLVSAFLGEMDKLSGKVNTYGTVAYVSQQAWIQNATLKDNILFGQPLNTELYEKVIEACALKPDLEILPGGDMTEIGEKGINLSGGQKQRVSLARAVYANADIYFLDDPLSAVDSHVGKHIFDKVIGPKGILKHKTKLLVTHGITYLPQTEQILVMKDGQVSESGTYRELLDKKGAFAEFLLQHISEDNNEDLDELKDTLIDSPISDEVAKRLTRHRSRVSESHSESESDHIRNGSIKRQKSTESSAERSLRKSSKDDIQNGPKAIKQGQQLIETEKAETGNVSWAVYKHYLKSIGFFLMFATLSLNMVYQGFSVGSNVWLGVWADDNSNGTLDTGKRDMYLGVYGALGIGQVVSTLLSSLALYLGTLNAAKILHRRVLYNIMRVPLTTFFDVTPLGRILNRFSKDVDTLDNGLPMTLRGWVNCFFSVIGTLAVISYTTPLFIAVIIPIAILYYFIQRFYVATSRQLKRLESVSRSPIYSHFSETITGVQAIRAFNQQERFTKESERKVDLNQVCYYPGIISNRWLAIRLEMIGNLIIFFAALFAVLSRGPNMSAGLVGLSITYSLQITQTLNWLVRMTSDVETNIVAVERIKEYADAPQEAPWEIPSKNPSKGWPEQGSVKFRDYAVRYRPELDLVLKGVNFDIKGGEKVGIVGRTGAGKSSLTLSLFRIIEAASGQILIDDVNISELGLHTLRSRLTIIPQDAVLFSGTLRMNLDPFDKHNDDEVWQALEHAHLKAFVKGLTAGLQHEVNEGGENLSVGQRQLICLARALLRKTKLLILDEATAAVDLETDDLIQKTIREEFKDCTVLTIAHRLNTIMDSDRIVVLDKGQIVEFDSPKNLLSNPSSVFSSMHKDAGLS